MTQSVSSVWGYSKDEEDKIRSIFNLAKVDVWNEAVRHTIKVKDVPQFSSIIKYFEIQSSVYYDKSMLNPFHKKTVRSIDKCVREWKQKLDRFLEDEKKASKLRKKKLK